MQYFFDGIIKPYIAEHGYKKICEIGASEGSHSDKLLSIETTSLSIIDPCFDADLSAKYKNIERVKILKGLSLQILPKISDRFDCILIDADHNWYTVFNELKTINERNILKKGGTIFLHDVCWPYGKRDMYYFPDSIPEEFRHSHAKKAMLPNQAELSEKDELNCQYYNAIFEGGSRNGVLTAVEDFLKEYGKQYIFFYFKMQYGIGFFIKKNGIRTRILSIRWFCILKCYEILRKVKLKFPNLYPYTTRIARVFNIKPWP